MVRACRDMPRAAPDALQVEQQMLVPRSFGTQYRGAAIAWRPPGRARSANGGDRGVDLGLGGLSQRHQTGLFQHPGFARRDRIQSGDTERLVRESRQVMGEQGVIEQDDLRRGDSHQLIGSAIRGVDLGQVALWRIDRQAWRHGAVRRGQVHL